VVKIADFGIAKLSPSVTSAGASDATADYIAPEQVNNSPVAALVDHRADLYSLGCVFHLLLTGRAPFAGGTAEEKVRRHMWDEPQRVEGSRPDVPPAVAAIVHRLLAKYPGDRFASAAELLAHLAACVQVPPGGAHFDHAPLDEASAGTHSELGSATFATVSDPSPWARIADEAAENTAALSAVETHDAPPQRPKPAGRRGEVVPLWMTACLLVGVVTACLMVIRLVVMLLS
jgi:serine/threonine-protein kinase